MKAKRKGASEKTYRAIGRFIFEFSQLEYEIRFRVAEEAVVGFEYFNAMMMHDFAALCTAARSVFDLAYCAEKDRWKKMEALLKKAHSLGDTRNAVAHGLWVPFHEGGKTIRVSRSLKLTVSTKQAAALEKKAREAKAIRVGIANLADEGSRKERGGRVWK